jgi:N-methylhydantoinase A
VITLRVVAAAATEPLNWPKLEAGTGRNPDDALMYVRKTTFDTGETHDTPRFDRTGLKAGQAIDGPAIVVQQDSTTLIPPGYEAAVSEFGNLHVREVA